MSTAALIFDGPGRLSISERSDPELKPTEVRVHPESVGICGSDVHGFTGANQRRAPGMVMGHEAAGTVVEVGSAVTDITVGDQVVINPAVTCGECDYCIAGADHRCPHRRLYGCVLDLPGAFAESLVVEALNVVPFAGPAPLEWGALVEPLAVGDHGAGLLQHPRDARVLVIGGGPIGIGAALGARRRGWSRVVVSEPDSHRRAVAEALGLQAYDPVRGEPLEPFGAVIECVALPQTIEFALSHTWPGAEVAIVGLGATTIPFPLERLVVGERIVRGSFNYSRREFGDVADWVASEAVDLSPMVEARVDLAGVIQAFEGYADGSNHAMKTLYRSGEAIGEGPGRPATDAERLAAPKPAPTGAMRAQEETQ